MERRIFNVSNGRDAVRAVYFLIYWSHKAL